MTYVRPENLHCINELVGAVLKSIRKQSGLSRDELGEQMNLTAGEIKARETAQTPLSSADLYGASQALNVPVKVFFLPLLKSELANHLVDDVSNIVAFSNNKPVTQ